MADITNPAIASWPRFAGQKKWWPGRRPQHLPVPKSISADGRSGCLRVCFRQPQSRYCDEPVPWPFPLLSIRPPLPSLLVWRAVHPTNGGRCL